MNAFRRMALVAGVLLTMGSAEAQYTFSVQIVISGNCFSSASRTEERNLRQIVNEVNSKLRAVPLTKTECMAMSQQFAGEMAVYAFNEYGCSMKVVITPCVCTGCQEEVSSPDQGGSYNSANAGSEVRDWANDVDARMKALGQQGATPPPSQVEAFFGRGTGDKTFDDALKKGLGDFEFPNNAVKLPDDFELLANMENVQRYLDTVGGLADMDIADPDNLYGWFHDVFKRVSDFDIDSIRSKLESQRTEAEKQALLDYQKFRQLLADKKIQQIEELQQTVARSEETRAYEMAVLSEDCYGDSKGEYLAGTNYMKVSTDFFTEDNPMKGLLGLIDDCNRTTNETGFHAELYYNKVTGEYTIAFEGTNFSSVADVATDYLLVTNKIPEQHNQAMKIADYIKNLNLPETISINLTGHSLGGSLASVVGMATGLPTYTYNSAGVNNAMIEFYGLNENNYGNIKAYSTHDDPITSGQEGPLKPKVVTVVGTIIPVVISVVANAGSGPAAVVAGMEGDRLQREAKKGNIASPAVGNKETIETGQGHSIEPMVKYFEKDYDKHQSGYSQLKKKLYQAGHSIEHQIEDHILIIMQE